MSIFDTSDKPRIIIAPCSPIVRQHAIVLFSAAQQVLRQRALDEIKRIGDEGDESAYSILQQFDEWKKQD